MTMANDSTEIDRTVRQWAHGFANGDAALLASLVTEDAEFWSHGVQPLVGRPAVKAAFDVFFERFAIVQDFFEIERRVNGDWCFVRGEERNVLTPKAGGPSVQHRQGVFSILHRDADGRWRFARGMTNQAPGMS
jgi:uncharacterized protein (TIGR02246 family)